MQSDVKRMDALVAGISGLQQARVMGQVQMAVAREILDVQKQGGAAALELLEAASEGATRASDALAASATGLGASLDVYG